MIKKISLRNWKSFEESEFYIDSLSFLIGTNASGKSNLLEAFAFVSNLAKGKNIDDAIELVRGDGDWVIRKGQESFIIEVIVGYPDYTGEYEYKLLVAKNEDSTFRISAESLMALEAPEKGNRRLFLSNSGEGLVIAMDEDKVDDSQGNINVVNAKQSLLSQVELLPLVQPIKDEISRFANELKSIFLLSTAPSEMRGYKKASTELKPDASNLAPVLVSLPEDRKLEIEALLTEYLRPFPEKDIKQVWALPVGLQQKDGILCCKEEWIDGEEIDIDSAEMSDGTLRFIAIVASLLLRPEHSLIAIEEVDNGLHPSRAALLVNVLRQIGAKRNIDIICTTHNPTLIDALGVEMIPFISYVSRDRRSGCSRIDLLEEKKDIVRLMSMGTVGDLMVNSKI